MTNSSDTPSGSSELLLVNQRISTLLGVDIVPVHEELAAITAEETVIVNEVLGGLDFEAITPDAEHPVEGLVIITAADNLRRTSEEGRQKEVFTWAREDELLVGLPNSAESSRHRRQNGQISVYPGRGTTVGMPTYSFYRYEEGQRGRSAAYPISKGHPWGFTPKELKAREVRDNKLRGLRERFIAEHPLGEGAILVTNRYGGIDPTDIEGTTRSILARMIYADELVIPDEHRSGTDSDAPLVEQGLLDARLSNLLGGSFAELRETIRPSLVVIRQMREAGQDTAQIMPVIENLVRTRIEEFLVDWGREIVLAAQLLRNPDDSNRVLRALVRDHKSEISSTLRDGVIQEYRRR